jgi:hypothetical protein
MIQDQFHCKDLEKNPWISEFITAIDTGTEKLKGYYSKTRRLMETQYALAAMLDPSQKLGIFGSPEWGRLLLDLLCGEWGYCYNNSHVRKLGWPGLEFTVFITINPEG